MHIGVVPDLTDEDGGVRQYSLGILAALRAFCAARPAVEVTLVVDPDDVPRAAPYADPTWRTLPPIPPRSPSAWQSALRRLRQFVGEGWHRDAWRAARRATAPWLRRSPHPDRVRLRPDISRWYRDQSIELMLYPAADSLAFEADIPYVVAIHDLQHRLQPEFAEVSADGEWEDREYLYRNATRHATLILAESEVGREDILQCYGVHGVGRDRVKVLRYCPAPYLTGADPERLSARARAVYQLPERYLFYPANFWPSKNHVGLVRALGQLRERHDLCVPLVLSGSRVGALRERTFRDMMTVADGVGVTEQVRYLGWVPDDLIAGLFAGATAMVMPTYFGPTNLPAVEAWSFGCPVLTSRLRGIAEQVGDAGLLANPASVEEIADGIRRLWTDERLRAELARRGRERCDAYTEADFQVRFASIMEEAIRRVDAAGRGRP